MARYINLPPARVDEEIERALDEIRGFFQMDCWGLLKAARDENNDLYISHASCGKGITQVPKTVT